MRIGSMPLHLRRLLLGTTALTALAATAGVAVAGQPGLPTGGVVTAGTATIGPAAGNRLTVTTSGARTVIDWQGFSIASGNQVAIQQPGTSSITVNEVVGANPSQIFGDLSSNGRVVLANPNGIWFGPNAHVDVAGLVASTATLSQAALKSFAAGGRLSLDTPGSATASIVNDGRITIANQGLAALVAPGVRNSGIIEATLGTVALASGTTSTLDFYGDGLINLAVTGPVTALAKGPDGKPMKAAVENTGTLAANGGHVLVTADVVKGVVDNVINMSGVAEARGVTVSGGDIVLDGGDGGVTVAGTLDVTGNKAGQAGGTVEVTGGAVTVAATAKLDASGAKRGGTVQIGGGPHGGGSLHHAQTVLVQGGASITADATQDGDGGTVSLWSDQATRFAGAISAQGAGAGNGGWVETSGHWLSIAGGRVDTSAPGGRFGTWLLDPDAVEIVHGAAATSGSTFTGSTVTDGDINAALAANNVIVQTTGGTAGDLTVESTANISWASSANLRLDATANAGNINVNGPISGANGSLTLASVGSVSVAAPITTGGLFDASFGNGATFSLGPGASITAGAGVTVAPAGGSVGTVDIAGRITAPEILLMSSDHQHDGANGKIALASGATITNTLASNSPGLDTAATRADTIFYAGPHGTISIDGGVAINGGAGNVAFVADTLTLPGAGAPSTISSTGRVIVSPGSTDGELFAGLSVPDPFTTGSVTDGTALLGLAVPGGAAPIGIAVGTPQAGSFAVSQALIDFVSGTGGTGADPVERLQIGLAGHSAPMTLGGPVNFPAEVSFSGTDITVAANAVLTTGGQSDFDGKGLLPSGMFFTLTQRDSPTPASLTFAQGSTISSVGSFEVDSICIAGACAVSPVTTFAGTITARDIVFTSYATQDFGIAGDTVRLLPSSIMQATGQPDPSNALAENGIYFQTGRRGSLTIAAGATLDAGQSVLDLFADTFGIGATASLKAGAIDLDTGTADNWAFPAQPDGNGHFVEEVPTITLGGTSALGLSLSSATLAAFATAAGTVPTTIGDDRPRPTPVLIVAAGNATLSANMILAADAVTLNPGSILSGGTLRILAQTPTNIPSASDASSAAEFPPPNLPAPTITLGGSIGTSGGALTLESPVVVAATGASIDTRIGGSNGTGGNVVFAGSIDGPGGLTVNAGSAAVSEGGPVGAASPLSAMTINAGTIALGDVETSGAQSYTGATTLDGTAYSAGSFAVSGPTVLANSGTITSTGVGGITFGGTLDGAFGLTLNAAGGAVTAGPIGSLAALGNLSINAGTIAVGQATTSGAQSLTGVTNLGGTYAAGGSFTMAGPAVLTASTTISSAGGIALGTVDGPFGLTLNAGAAAVTLQGAALASLTANAGTISLGSVTTTGAQSYTGTTTFNGSYRGASFTANGADILSGATGVVASAGNIGFGGTLDGTQNLVLSAMNGTVSFGGAVGGRTALAGLTVTANGIVAGSVSTRGAQSYAGAMSFGGTYQANGFTTAGPLVLIGDAAINGGIGDITFGGTINGQQKLALVSSDANVFFGGTVGSAAARLTLLSIAGADNATVLNNSSLFVHDFTATNIAGTLSFGDHSLESDDLVTIQATSVDGRVISTDASITANTVNGIIQGNMVSVNASGAVNEQVTAGDANISGGSFAGSVQATRSASIGTTGDIAGNVSVTGGSATLSGANISGSVTSSGLARISASQNVSAAITGGGGVDVAASAGTVSGAITSTGGTPITVAATSVASAIIAQSGGPVDITASNSITGSVTGGRVALTAPLIDEQIEATSAVINSADANLTGFIGGVDASLLGLDSTDITQIVLGATQQVASNADAAAVAEDESDDEKKKKKRARTNDPVYDFANQYIDSLISGKPAR